MAKPKKNARSEKAAKSKKTATKKTATKKSQAKKAPAKKAAAKKAQAKKTPSKKTPSGKKHPPKKKNTGKVTGRKSAVQKKKKAKAPAKKVPVKKALAKKSKASRKPAARPATAPKRAKAPAKQIKPVKKSAKKPEARKPEARKPKVGKPKAGKPAPKAAKAAEPAIAPVPAPAAVVVAPAPVSAPVKPDAKSDDKPDNKRDRLREKIIGRKKLLRPTAFTLDEAREIAKNADKSATDAAAPAAAQTPAAPAKPDLDQLAKAIAPSHVQAASLADILGFNPKKAQKARLFADPETIPEKYRRYYKLLLDLRSSLTEGLSLHTEETLRRSTKDDAGDLSSYGQHMADAGTDTFDRDFALSMVANEQEALTEIDAAIKRIENGTYGICEVTQKPIARERLLAVPFTRYSTEAQKEIERNRMRVRTAAGLFGEIGDDAGRVDDGGGDEE
ncbi:MAG: TraR/DksA C4-type zinc finger protein [Opitutaceae bacterium]|jgi:RNA polymerase-binding transcription factor DksA|nr:TraR/DksA C4-type zinc finger protein [Opitutaceae bacterium]